VVMHGGVGIDKGRSLGREIAGPALLKQSFLAEKGVMFGDATTPQEHHRVRESERGRPGTWSGTGTGYHPTALSTVAPYALPVPEQVPGLVLDTHLLQARRNPLCPYGIAYRRGGNTPAADPFGREASCNADISVPRGSCPSEIGILLPNNQRQLRTLHIQKARAQNSPRTSRSLW